MTTPSIYSLYVDSENFLKIVATLREYSEDANLALDQRGNSQQEIEWNDSAESVTKVSKLFPDVVIRLYETDFWNYKTLTYFKNGKSYSVEQLSYFPEFDEKNLR